MINSMARSLITAKKYYRSMLAGNDAYNPGSFDLISTTVLGSSAASVTFDVTGLGSTYKHLQLRMALRSDRAANDDGVRLQLNADTGTNYAIHRLFGNGSSVGSGGGSGYNGLLAGYGAGSSSTGSSFGALVTDILDFASTTKNTTSRSLSGITSGNLVSLNSGAWINTAAVTSIKVISENSANFVSGSRFSIYGVK